MKRILFVDDEVPVLADCVRGFIGFRGKWTTEFVDSGRGHNVRHHIPTIGN